MTIWLSKLTVKTCTISYDLDGILLIRTIYVSAEIWMVIFLSIHKKWMILPRHTVADPTYREKSNWEFWNFCSFLITLIISLAQVSAWHFTNGEPLLIPLMNSINERNKYFTFHIVICIKGSFDSDTHLECNHIAIDSKQKYISLSFCSNGV